MREIGWVIYHTVACWETNTVQDILHYEKVILQWENPGYHLIVDRDGKVHQVLSLDKVANGVGGIYNRFGIQIAWIGGIQKKLDKNGKVILDAKNQVIKESVDNRTDAKMKALADLAKKYRLQFPKAEVLGHRDIWFKYGYKGARKDCPNFDVAKFCNAIGVNPLPV